MEGIRISNKEYREREGVSSTDLKHMVKSPAHFRYWKDNPQEDTPALLFGRAVHKYVLEKDDFFTEFAVAPNVDRRTKEGKEEWTLFEVNNQGKDIISADDFEKIKAMYDALYSTPYVKSLLSGIKELSFFVVDESTGITLKARPDCLTEIGDTKLYVEYKTAEDAELDAFMKQAVKLNYDLQASFYRNVLKQATGFDYQVIFVVQEKKSPYVVNILEANKYFLASGEDVWKSNLELYTECERTNNWYGYVNKDINSLGLPKWLAKQYDYLQEED